MDRRNFLKLLSVGSAGLFLPRYRLETGWWKRGVGQVVTPWDYEIALLDGEGIEIWGRGYRRLRGVRGDFGQVKMRPEMMGWQTKLEKDLQFPTAKGKWGKIMAVRIISKDGIFSDTFPLSMDAPVDVVQDVRPNDTLIFKKGSIAIAMG